jgi:hypothetical protein
MVPVYTFLSSISALSYPASLYMEPLQEFYEAIALASIFNLFCNYIKPTLSEQLEFFHSEAPISSGGKSTSDPPKKGLRWFKVCIETEARIS